MPKLKEVDQTGLKQLSSVAEALNKDQELQEQNQQHHDDLRIQNLKKYLSLRQQLMRKAEEDEIEYEAKARENVARRYNKTLTKEQRKAAAEAYEESNKLKLKDRKKYIKELKEEQQENLKFYKQELKEKAKLRAAAEKQQYSDQVSAMFGKGYTISERKDAFKKLINDAKSGDGASVLKTMDAAAKAMSNYVKKLESTMTQIASKKGSIDTRLQGLTGNQYMGSYWSYLEHSANSLAFGSPLIKQSDLVNNMDSLVSQGIAYNVEQRAFLATISDRIATTFSVTDATLLRLVKIQQQDTTASRLGMESALTAFLNNMYETTEYMSGLAERTRSSLVEAQALMSGAAATELEYQVQKWMGSLYSVGMSDTAVSSIASVIGQLAAGQIDSITNGSTGNLLVMAANKAGLSISDILANGLDANSSNSLMTAMVSYMSDLYSSSNNKVVQQQLASAFGVSASDLKAAANLSTSLNNVSSQSLTNAGMLQRLYDMGGTMWQRTSTAQMMTNILDNFEYTLANGIAANPVLFATTQLANMLDDLVGGIALPDIKVMGTGVNPRTTVADLMRVGALGGSVLSGVGSMISNLASGGSLNIGGQLEKMFGSGSNNVITRGTGGNLSVSTSGYETSSSGYVGNSSGDDIQASTLASANDSANQQLITAKESEDADVTNSVINENIVAILSLLNDVVDGTKTLHTAGLQTESSWN